MQVWPKINYGKRKRTLERSQRVEEVISRGQHPHRPLFGRKTKDEGKKVHFSTIFSAEFRKYVGNYIWHFSPKLGVKWYERVYHIVEKRIQTNVASCSEDLSFMPTFAKAVAQNSPPLRLERDAWSMVKRLRQAINEYAPTDAPPCRSISQGWRYCVGIVELARM